MPKRKIRDSLLTPEQEAAALAAVKEARQHPRKLSKRARERLATWPRVSGSDPLAGSPWVIARHETLVIERRGERVYREPGKAGADLPVPPYYRDMLKRQRDFETECAKVQRALSLPSRHRQNAVKRAQRIRELAKTITGRGRIKRIARKVGCSVSTVTRALRK